MESTSDTLAPRLTVSQCVAEYESAVADLRRAFDTIKEAEKRINNTFAMESHKGVSVEVGSYGRTSGAERVLADIRSKCWEAIVERTEVRRALSVKRAEELDKMLRNGEMPEITVESVQSMVASFATQLPDLLTEAVTEVFDFLRPPGSLYKTNTELEIGERAILSYMLEDASWGPHYRVNYDRDKHLTAIENVFSALDGKGQITRGYHSDLANAINATPLNGDGRGETPYFAFRCCRNRNLHLRFKRLDLLKRLNEIAGGKTLKPHEEE